MALEYNGLKAGRRGKITAGAQTGVLVQLFQDDTGASTEADVYAHASCIKWGSAHPVIPGAYCNDIDILQASGKNGWEVTASFTTERVLNENPLFDPAEIDWEPDNFEEALVVDRDGNAVCNSAGDLYEDVFRERSRRLVTVEKNVATVPDWIITAEDAVNSAAFFLDGVSIGVGIARLPAPSISRKQIRNGVTFRRLRMIFLLKKDGWADQRVDAGYRYKSGTERLRITNDDGSDVTQPVALDGSGAVLANPTAATIVFNSFNVYPSYDFNLLPLT